MLGWELLDNSLMQTELETQKEVKLQLRNAHKLPPAPKHANGWDRRDWVKNAKLQYQQFTCKGVNGQKCPQSNNKTQDYCTCAPAKWMCKACHIEHIVKLRNDGL